VQGDHCDRVIAHLQQAGHTVKRAGGMILTVATVMTPMTSVHALRD
jgi:hypothetical protein